MLRLPTENTLDREETIMAEWLKTALIDIVELIGGGTPKTSKAEYWGGNINWLSVKDFNNENRYVYSTEKTITEEGLNNSSTKLLKKDDIIISARGTVGELAMIPFPMAFNQSCYGIRAKEGIDSIFLYYLIKNSVRKLKAITHGSVFDTITRDTFANIEVAIPDIKTQHRIAKMLADIDDKVENNQRINNNLEEQISALFANMFGHFIDSLDNSDIKLGDLIESVDNRGKTPPLSDEPTDYPIIDVRALSGNSRLIDYTNCTKYVSKEAYNNWFRSGHPKEYDILISTVGSLAEMKIFLGTTGCIAQNVVGFRTKGISPLYLYQYLNYIKNDLVAYNIGSVQPSIKITHIIKHSIYVASKEDIEIFDSIARDITKKIFANCQENEALKQMRDTLLPKLMSGELDVSNIEI